MHMAQVIFFGILQCLFHFITIIICAHTFESTWKKSFFFSFASLARSLARFAPYFYPTAIFAALSPFPISLAVVLFVTAAAIDGLRKTCTRASRMQRAAKCSNWQRIRCFSHVYIRFNPFLCYSISVNLLSVQWQRKINVISMFYR